MQRDGSRDQIEMSGIVGAACFGHPERFELSVWAEELPDHSYAK